MQFIIGSSKIGISSHPFHLFFSPFHDIRAILSKELRAGKPAQGIANTLSNISPGFGEPMSEGREVNYKSNDNKYVFNVVVVVFFPFSLFPILP